MFDHFWGILLVLGPVLAGAGVAWTVVLFWRRCRFDRACRDFHRQRERLEVKFVQLGQLGGEGGRPRWTDCEFDDDVAYARSRSTGELCAFVAVTFEMEEFDGNLDEAGDVIGRLHGATAVFRFDGTRWDTDGRAIFNLSPAEAIHRYQRDLEMVGRKLTPRS